MSGITVCPPVDGFDYSLITQIANVTVRGDENEIAALKEKGYPLLLAADVLGTGSSRKSATNSLLWHIGHDLAGVPNKRGGGVVAGGKLAPIFYTTMLDAGALPLECEVKALENGAVVEEGDVSRV